MRQTLIQIKITTFEQFQSEKRGFILFNKKMGITDISKIKQEMDWLKEQNGMN